MHFRCRKGLACLAFRSWPPRVCGTGNHNSARLLPIRTRSFSGPLPLTANGNHRRHFTRYTDTTSRSAQLPMQPNYGFASASRDTRLRAEVTPTTLYDWRTLAPNAQLHYIRTEEAANECVARIVSRPRPHTLTIGLDVEWRPTFTAGRPENPVSLVQIACDEEILLVQVSAIQAFPTALRDLLESGDSVKAGVGIQYDCKKLWKDHRVSVRNCVDLALLARSVDARWKGPYKGSIGLSRLVKIYLGLNLPKGGVQKSNWEMELSAQQQEYAANDSHSSLTIYRTLIQRALVLAPPPESECFTFDAIQGKLRDYEGRPWFPFNPHYDPGPPPAKPEAGTAYSGHEAMGHKNAVDT